MSRTLIVNPRLGVCGIASAAMLTAGPAAAIDVAVSTAAPTSVMLDGGGTFPLDDEQAVAFDSDNLVSASLLVSLSASDLKAFHILDNGNYLISNNTSDTFGSNAFAFNDDHVIEYNPNTDIATSFFDFAGVATSTGDLDIDAIAVLPNGDIIFSNTGDVTIGGMTFAETDIVRFTANAGTATNVSLFFDGSQITGGDNFNNVSGVSVLGDTMALSVSTGGVADMMLGGVTFTRNDIVLVDLNTGAVTLGMEGDNVFSAAAASIDAVHLNVPEPGTGALALGLLAILSRRRR